MAAGAPNQVPLAAFSAPLAICCGRLACKRAMLLLTLLIVGDVVGVEICLPSSSSLMAVAGGVVVVGVMPTVVAGGIFWGDVIASIKKLLFLLMSFCKEHTCTHQILRFLHLSRTA